MALVLALARGLSQVWFLRRVFPEFVLGGLQVRAFAPSALGALARGVACEPHFPGLGPRAFEVWRVELS